MSEMIQIPVVGRRRGNLTATVEVLGEVELRAYGFAPKVLIQVVLTENGGKMVHSTTHYIIPASTTIPDSELIVGRRRNLLKLKDGSTVKPTSFSSAKEQKALIQYEQRCHGYFYRMWRK